MTTEPCPACGQTVSVAALNCPHCGHPIRTPRRGPGAKLVKWAFVAFNGAMLLLIVLTYVGLDMAMTDAEAEGGMAQLGTAIGGRMLLNDLYTVWIAGALVLGLATLLTRPTRAAAPAGPPPPERDRFRQAVEEAARREE